MEYKRAAQLEERAWSAKDAQSKLGFAGRQPSLARKELNTRKVCLPVLGRCCMVSRLGEALICLICFLFSTLSLKLLSIECFPRSILILISFSFNWKKKISLQSAFPLEYSVALLRPCMLLREGLRVRGIVCRCVTFKSAPLTT